MKCPQCNFENPPGMKFCGECGAKLTIICPACQFQNPPENKFCGECGARLASAPPAPVTTAPTPQAIPTLPAASRKAEESKRKLVTVLFADVSGYTAMSEHLDHEEVNAIMRSCWHRLDSIILALGGTVDKHVGDAVMATFGADSTHEDDPIRAVKAGAAMLKSLQEFSATLEETVGFALRMRIGINVGEVTVGEVAQSTGERSVIGPAVNLASRLEHEANVGTVLVSEAVYRLTRWLFDYLPLEPKDIKGIEEKVATFELIGEKLVPDRDRGIEGVETELIGREKELYVLDGVLERLMARQGGVICFVGEAGVGKSRLTAEFRNRAMTAKVGWHGGRCFSYEANNPFGLLLDVLHSFFGLTKGSSESQVVDSIRQELSELIGDDVEREEKAALIASLFSVRIANPFVDGISAKLRHDLTMAAIKNLFLAHARKEPTIVVLEDLHWVDTSSLSFFNDLARSTGDVPMVLLCQFRPDFHPTWGALPGLTQLDLSTLSLQQTTELVRSILKDASLPPGLAHFIHGRSDGNPYFTEEIVKSLIDSGYLVKLNGRWETAGDVDKLNISATVQELLYVRIDRLAHDARQLLEVASVIGRSFPKLLLEEACKPNNHFSASLDVISHEGLVVQRSYYPEAEYSFRHALVQEVAYNSISRRQRSAYHERVARATEVLYADRLMEVIDTVANHYYLSPNAGQAIRYLIRAGNKARDAYANEEALQLYERAIEVVERATRPGTRLLTEEAESLPAEQANAWRIEALLNRADVHLLVGEGDKAQDGYQTVVDLVQLRSKDDARQLADVYRRIAKVHEVKGDYGTALEWLNKGLDVLGSRHLVERRLVGAQIYIAGATVFFRQGDYGQASEWARLALSVIEGTDALTEQAQCYSVLGAVARNQGNIDAAIEYRERSLSLQERTGDMVAAAMTYNNLGVIYFDLGEWDKSLSYYGKSLAVREKMGDVRAIAGLSSNAGLIHLGRGQFDKAERDFERSLATSREAGFAYGEGMALINLGVLWLRVGNLTRAESCLNDCLRLLDQIRSREYLSEAYARLAEIKLAQGAVDEALSLGEKAMEVATELRSRADVGIAACVTGRALAALGDDARAEQLLVESMAALEEAKNQQGLGKTLYELALLHGRAGRSEEKKRLLERAYDIFRHLGAGKDVALVEAEL